MTDSDAIGVDPRYDPRFQRGYSDGDLAGAPGPSVRQSQESQHQRDSPQELERRASERTAPKRAPEPAGETFEQHAARDAAESAALARDGAQAEEPARRESTGDTAPGRLGDPPADPASGVPDQPIEVIPGSTRWFWIAIGACIAFIVVGGLLSWTQASDPGIYGTTPSTIDATTRMFLSIMAPALVQGGVIGAVAVLVVWATRSARTGGGSR